ncbi:hypothetical protein EDD18DRAFT_1109604 [Armillaria luteobubalina]|uniref:Uncharacterized protein n=1 Tax=Armillaria luteobubalina TaxID=153913 RepID=A0AA39UT88_9AGAR|nr:hypothetical protein EDD18DRAFT_1109604 [Armillaria luteobubalina]
MSPAATSTLKKMLKKDLQELVHQLDAEAKRKDQELAATKSQLDKYQQRFEQSENILQMTQDLSDSWVSELQAHMRAQEFKAQALAAELRVELVTTREQRDHCFREFEKAQSLLWEGNMAGASTSEREAQIAECQAQNEYLIAQMAQCLEENSRLMSENDTLNKGVSVVHNKIVPALECSICYEWVAKIPLILKVSCRPVYCQVFSSISGEISGEGEDSGKKAHIQKELDRIFGSVS